MIDLQFSSLDAESLSLGKDGADFDVGERLKINEAAVVEVSDATIHAVQDTEVKGILSLNNATAAFDAKLTVEGSLPTEGSLLSLGEDLELKKGSVAQGGAGDLYEIGGDFKIEIELATDFDLSAVTVSFVGPPDTEHKLTVVGVDVGADPSGYISGNGILTPGILLPEPGTLSLLLLALFVLGHRAVRRRHR